MTLFKSNQQQARDALATEPVRRLLFQMAGPSIIAMLMQAMYNTVDSMYVSRISTGSLAAVMLAFPVQMIMGALSTGIGVGINLADFINFGFVIVMNIWLRRRVLCTWDEPDGPADGRKEIKWPTVYY